MAANDLFEFWLWALTLSEASTTLGAQSVRFHNRPQGWIRLRTNPGNRPDAQFTYATLTGPGGGVELHTGIYITGISGAHHELDVVAIRPGIPSTQPETTYKDLQWAIEAKLYSPNSGLSPSIPRAVLGTAYDVGLLGSYRGSQAKQGNGLPHWRFLDPLMMLVTSTHLTHNGRELLRKRKSPSGRHNPRPMIAYAESVQYRAHDRDREVHRRAGEPDLASRCCDWVRWRRASSQPGPIDHLFRRRQLLGPRQSTRRPRPGRAIVFVWKGASADASPCEQRTANQARAPRAACSGRP